MCNLLKNKKGISLITLVITTVIIIILSAVVVNTTFDHSSVRSAKRLVNESQKTADIEKLKLAKMRYFLENSGELVSIQDYINYLDNEKIINRNKVEYEDENTKAIITLDDDYVYEIKRDDDSFSIEFLGLASEVAPNLKIRITEYSYNGITITPTVTRSTGGKLEYYIKAKSESEYTFKGETNNTLYRYANLEQGETYDVKVIAKAKNGLETVATLEVSTYVVPTVKEEIKYNETAQILINAGNSISGTMQYKIGEDGTYGTELPTATDVGSYTVYYRIVDDINGNNVEEQSIIATISKGDLDVTATPYIGTYDTSVHGITVTCVQSGAAITYSSTGEDNSYSVTNPTYTNVNNYITYYKVEKYGYNTVSGSLIVTINKANGSVIAPTAKLNLKYTESAQELVNAGSSSTGTIQYKVGQDGLYSTKLPTATNVGTYTVYYRVVGDANHNDVAEQSLTVTIEKADLSVTATPYIGIYDGEAHGITVTCTTNEVIITYSSTGEDNSYSATNPTYTDVNTYTTYYKVEKYGYNTVSSSSTVVINKASGSITVPTAKTGLKYNESAQTLIDAGSSSTGTIQYKLDSGSYSTSLPTATNVGTYTVYYRVIGDANHNDVAEQSLSVTIAKGDLSVSASPYSGTYDANAHGISVSCTTSGAVVTYSSTGANNSYSSTNPTYTDVNTYTTYYKVEKASYNTVSGSLTVTINKASGSVTAPTAKTGLKYNESAQTLINAGSSTTGTIQYKVGSGSYSTALPTATNVGTYTVYYKVVGDANHNDVVEQSLSVTIANGDLSVSASPYSGTYDANAHGISVSCTTSGASITYSSTGASNSYSSTNPTYTNASTYTTYYKVEKTGYNTVSGSLTVTIGKANGSITAPTAKSGLKYNGSGQNLVNAGASSTGTVYYKLSTSSSWSTSIPQGTNVGTYTVQYYAAESTNYNATSTGSVNVTISNGDLSVSASAYSGTYDGRAHGISVSCTTSGAVVTYSSTGANNSYSSTNPTYTNVNTYTTYYKVEKSGYNTVSGSLTVTISEASGSITAPTAKSLTYTGSAQELVNAGSSSTGTVYYKLSTSSSWSTNIPQATDAGTYTVQYYAAASTNYNATSTGSVSVTIGKAASSNPTLTNASGVAGNTTYIGVSGGSGGTIYYRTSSNNSSWGGWTTTVPSSSTQGTIYVQAYVKGDANHSDTSATASETITISASTAYVGSTYYASAQDAINANTTATVVLTGNQSAITINSGKNITLNMNGKTISVSSGNAIAVNSGGTLTITGSGTITGNTGIWNNGGTINCGSAITVTGGWRAFYQAWGSSTISAGTYNGTAGGEAVAIDSGTLVITGGTFNGKANAAVAFGGTIKISGGTYSATQYAGIAIKSGATCYIKNQLSITGASGNVGFETESGSTSYYYSISGFTRRVNGTWISQNWS